MVIYGDIKQYLNGNVVLYCPDGTWFAAIPYLLSYIRPKIVKSLNVLQDINVGTVLFSWNFHWQKIDWVTHLQKTIIIGGPQVMHQESLPNLPNVLWFFGDVDGHLEETRIIPDYSQTLADDPFTDLLGVYSGRGCPWGQCTFCDWSKGKKYRQFNPEYVASVVMEVNKYGKVAFLSCPTHSVEWLLSMERHLPPGRRYAAYVRADDSGWSKLSKARDLFVGTEYLSESVLKRIKKGITVSQIKTSIREILSNDVNVYTNVIEDLWQTPDEREEHYRNMDELLRMPLSIVGGRLHVGRNVLLK
ncbi:MAG: hypothetical protein PH343_10700 [Nitrospira sp.]|nr:hypothetical protein [Nitrospira sp.]